ncbi:MAG: hypothetical protein IJ138_11515 [Clostridia bacterium]|nr:hypothetical protein [Clostridia bacterium]
MTKPKPLLLTAAVALLLTVSALTTAAETPAPTVTPTPTAAPDEAPTPRPTKPPASWQDYPVFLQQYIVTEEGRHAYSAYPREQVMPHVALYDRYAALLPKDGIVAVTYVPPSHIVTNFLRHPEPKAMESEIEPFIEALSEDNVFAFSSVEVLQKPLLSGETLFYYTDIHWTPRAAYALTERMLAAAGETLPPYEAFPREEEFPFLGTFYRDSHADIYRDRPDTLEIVSTIHPVRVWQYSDAETCTEVPLIQKDAPSSDRYCVYLGGPGAPWTVIENDAGNGKTCLVLTDSIGLCAIPLLAEVYSRVCCYDSRTYRKYVFGPVSALFERYDVYDVYVYLNENHALSGTMLAEAERQL